MADVEKKKKFNWMEFLAVTLLVIVTAVVTFAGTYWFMDKQIQEDKDATEQMKAQFESRIQQFEEKLKTATNTLETQVYTGVGYTMAYPKTWVYRVYNGTTNSLVAFATKEADLPAANSDQQPGISVSTAKTAAVAKDLTTDEAKATKETVTVGDNVSATKWTLAAGRTNDLGGEQKIVMYEVKLKDNTFIRIQNVNDNNVKTFNAMLKSLKLS